MRTLTLGVLIVAGGTLAALPFRRYRTIPDASTEPVQATGPTQSAIEQTDLRMLVDTSPQVSPASTAAIDDALSSNPPRWSAQAAPPRRRTASMPLTYEDLAVPVDQPDSVQQRFSATVDYRRNKPTRDAAAGLVMPRMDALGVSQQQEIQSRVAVIDHGSEFATGPTGSSPNPVRSPFEGHASEARQSTASVPPGAALPSDSVQPNASSASFASSQLRPAAVANLPKSDGQRQRHWIRQPD